VKRMLMSGDQAKAQLLIIDCCYANGAFLACGEKSEPFDVQGVCTMVATRWPVRAPASWPGTRYTAFSGALIETIEQGILGPEQYLTPDSVFKALRTRLTTQGQPEPDTRGNGTQIFLCQNHRYEPAQDQTSYPELLLELGTDHRIDLAGYAEAVREGHADGRRGDATRLVTEFCARRTATEIVRLAAVLRSADLGFYADHGIGRVYACRAGAEIAELIHLLHRQADIDIDGVLRTLAERPASVLADLRKGLGCGTCDDCSVINDQVEGRILEVWHPARLDELLKALHSRGARPVRSGRD